MFKKGLIAAVVVALAALLWTYTPETLPLPVGPAPTLPPVPATIVTIQVAETGWMDSNAVFAYRGGHFEKRKFGMDCFVIRHPQGTIIFEGGFGRRLQDHLKTVQWLLRAVSQAHLQTPLADQLQQAGIATADIKGMFLTHSHWDHIGAIQDLPGIPVWINQTERDFIDHGDEATALMRSFGPVNYHIYPFNGPAYAGFPSSFDVFGDGSVVIVPMAGHTPGSVVAFVRTAEHDYALIGDQAWQKEGVEIPTERPWMSRELVDEDPATVRLNVARLHRLAQANPRLVIVPSHDRRVSSAMPHLVGVSSHAPASSP